jgi:ATP-binding cassette subfamily B protein
MLRFPFYKQLDSSDCGPTCLKIICRFYGKHFSLDYLRSITHTSRIGASLLSLVEAAEKLELDAIARRAPYAELVELKPFPCIAFWNQRHYIVVYKIKKGKIYVSDPAHGLITMTESEFLAGWQGDNETGLYLGLKPNPEFQKLSDFGQDEDRKGFSRVYRYLLRYKNSLVQIIAGLVATSLLQAIFPFLTSMIVDAGIANKDISVIYLILLGQLGVFVGKTTVEIIRSQILLHLSTKINITLLKDFFMKLMSLPLGYFDSRKLGDILQRINDHKRVESFLTSGTLNTIFSILNLLIFGIVLAYYNSGIFSIFFLGSLVYVSWILLFMKKRAELDFKLFSQMSENHEKNYELIVGMQEIRLQNAEKKRRIQWELLQIKLFRLNVDSLSLKQIQSGGAIFINELKNILITFFAAKLVVDGQISLGIMLSISYITGQLNNPIMQLVEFFQSLQDAKLSLTRINEIHNKMDEENIYDKKVMDFNMGDILLKNLSFKYENSHSAPLILDNINLSIPANKVTAIVGSSGSGKTTLLKLLLKFYDPQMGSISMNGIPFKELSNSKWRDRCGVVMQEGFIFNDTVVNNIVVNEDEPNIEKLHKVAKAANIFEYVINLPNGFYTQIGGHGLSMSTGQKQRILIARALYKNPALIILDEATSALDALNERSIANNLQELFKNKTVIIVAHRLSTVRNADKIVVLNNGKIIEEGRHEDLVDNGGLYYSLVKNQLELGK